MRDCNIYSPAKKCLFIVIERNLCQGNNYYAYEKLHLYIFTCNGKYRTVPLFIMFCLYQNRLVYGQDQMWMFALQNDKSRFSEPHLIIDNCTVTCYWLIQTKILEILNVERKKKIKSMQHFVYLRTLLFPDHIYSTWRSYFKCSSPTATLNNNTTKWNTDTLAQS